MGLLESLKSLQKRMAGHAEILKSQIGACLKEKSAEIKEAIGPEKVNPVKMPERAFGREGGEDVKQVVWTSHHAMTPEGQRFYEAVGLTQQGYYKTAEVQVYGAEEKWRWQPQRHMEKAEALGRAETSIGERLKPKPEAKAAKVPAPAPPVKNEPYFPNVWHSNPVAVHSGTLVGVVNQDKSDGLYYAGVHHFPKKFSADAALRWSFQPHQSKDAAIKRAEIFVRRGAKSIEAMHKRMQRLAREHQEDARMGRGEIPSNSNILRYKPRSRTR